MSTDTTTPIPRPKNRRAEIKWLIAFREKHGLTWDQLSAAQRLADATCAVGTIELQPSRKKPARKCRRAKFPGHLPRIRTTVELEKHDRQCCGALMEEMGEEVTQRLDLPLRQVAVARDQAVALLVSQILEALDAGLDFGLESRCQHLPDSLPKDVGQSVVEGFRSSRGSGSRELRHVAYPCIEGGR